jgi:hypothetical protein
MKKLIILFVAAVACSSLANAQDAGIVASNKPGWHKIGDVRANFTTESESIMVLGRDKFKSVKLKVADAPITISNVVVVYDDDKTQEIPVSASIEMGGESNVYTLKDQNKAIKKVTFTYKSEPNDKDKKALVELYGLK